jgi:hypothetical protein
MDAEARHRGAAPLETRFDFFRIEHDLHGRLSAARVAAGRLNGIDAA